MANVGCRIYTKINRPEKSLIEGFRGLPVANIDDCMGRIACCDSSLKGYEPLPHARNCLHSPLSRGRQSDVPQSIGIGAAWRYPGNRRRRQHAPRALCGEIMSHTAMKAGLNGFVIDGCIRDIDEISTFETFPVYAKGVTPNGPYKNGPGEINVPVSVCGQVIRPGDILIGDQDGLLVVKPEEAAELQEKAKAVFDMETQQKADIESGKGLSKPWLDAKLKELNCEIF